MQARVFTKYSPLIASLLFLFLGASRLEAAPPKAVKADEGYAEAKQDAMGICPPHNLLDEQGNVINPLKGINPTVPYSPKKTCGKCHDYDKITEAYHFQQGKGEKMTRDFEETYPWCTSPGQYGGRW